MGFDLRLTGAMIVIAYVVYVFVGQSLSPFASSRRRVRRLQLWYARAVAIVLVLASLVTLAVPVTSLKDGVMLSLTSAVLPLAIVSLFFSALVIKRLYQRWQEGHQFQESRSQSVVPRSLAELEGQALEGQSDEWPDVDRSNHPESGFDAELEAMNEQLEHDLSEYHQGPGEPSAVDDENRGTSQGLASKPVRQRRA